MDFGTITSALTAGGKAASGLNAIGALFGGGSNQAQMESQANSQMFAREMRDTAWRSTVDDMTLAGINPMAAFGSGANVGGGGGGSNGYVPKGLQRAQAAQATSAAMLTAEQIAKTAAETDLAQAMKDKTVAETGMTESSTGKINAETQNIVKTFDKLDFEMQELRSRSSLQGQQQITEAQRQKLIEAETELTKVKELLTGGQIEKTAAETMLVNIMRTLRANDIPMSQAMADYARSDMGKHEPYAKGAQSYGKAVGEVINSTIGIGRGMAGKK